MTEGQCERADRDTGGEDGHGHHPDLSEPSDRRRGQGADNPTRPARRDDKSYVERRKPECVSGVEDEQLFNGQAEVHDDLHRGQDDEQPHGSEIADTVDEIRGQPTNGEVDPAAVRGPPAPHGNQRCARYRECQRVDQQRKLELSRRGQDTDGGRPQHQSRLAGQFEPGVRPDQR
jgi:hypothetical protein